MGAHEPVHRNQRYVNRQHECGFCTKMVESGNTERVEHVIPTANGQDSRTVYYCSPSCFIRDKERVSNLG
jgi:hypothetical protein